jgi:DNA-binding transcriptional ArsR family regulator
MERKRMPPSSTTRARIIRVLDTAPDGLTCKQVERLTGVRHSTASAALTALAAQGKVFRLDGFRHPFHWVTPGNRQGRAVIGKTLFRKDILIAELSSEVERLKLALDYPTDHTYADISTTHTEQEPGHGTEHSRIHAESHH